MTESVREVDYNDYITIPGNPISKVGIFEYSGGQIDRSGKLGLPRDEIYKVFRPESTLNDPKCIESFKHIPLIDEHVWLGSEEKGATPPEEKGVEGITTNNVYFEYPYLKGDLKIFSQSFLKDRKKEISAGYLCDYEYAPGEFEGKPYTFLMRNMRGNHNAKVLEGRSGKDVRLLDQLTFDSVEISNMQEKKVMNKDEEGGVTLEMLTERLASLADIVAKLKDMPTAAEHTNAMIDEDETEKEVSEAEAEVAASTEIEATTEASPEMLLEKINEITEVVNNLLTQEKEEISETVSEDEEEDNGQENKKEKSTKTGDSKLNTARALDAAVQKAIKNHVSSLEQRDKLANNLSRFVGTFDHSKMSADDVANYGLRKFNLKAPKGQERTALTAYLDGLTKAKIEQSRGLDSALDTRRGTSTLSKYLRGEK